MFWNNKIHRKLSAIAFMLVIIIGTGLLAGCTAKDVSTGTDNVQDNKAVEQKAAQDALISAFDELMAGGPELEAVIGFIDENISKLSEEAASAMLLKLEELQKKELPNLEGKYYDIKEAQTKLLEQYLKNYDLSKLSEVQDQEIKDLLSETFNKGYKVETAEGMFFPVMDYEFYKKYSAYVTADIKEYIDIMAVESNITPVKDAALMIGWDEIINRALTQESFISNNPGSARVEAMKQLLNRYTYFMLYGTNNTSLISYETKEMMPLAKAAYTKAVKDNPDSKLMQQLEQFMSILSKTDYKLSQEADAFRKSIVDISALR